jgi:ParB/RepB/Spo0J family partition protein
MISLIDVVKSAPSAKAARVQFDQIDISIHHRPTHADKVGELVNSIRMLGLQSAPVVVERDGRYKLVSGRHRLEALRVIGYEEAPVRVVGFDDIQARLWTISENLHRNELTVLQRAEQIAEYARLTKEKLEGRTEDLVKLEEKMPSAEQTGISAQVDQKIPRGRPEGGESLAARKLGMDRSEVRRATRVDSIIPAAKEAAREAGLDHNQSALLKVASYADEDQVDAVKEIAKAKAEKAPAPRAAIQLPCQPMPKAGPLRNLGNMGAGDLAFWIKASSPNDRLHVIDVLRRCADILEDELNAEQAA